MLGCSYLKSDALIKKIWLNTNQYVVEVTYSTDWYGSYGVNSYQNNKVWDENNWIILESLKPVSQSARKFHAETDIMNSFFM